MTSMHGELDKLLSFGRQAHSSSCHLSQSAVVAAATSAVASRHKQSTVAGAEVSAQPHTVEDMEKVIAANLPIFYFHPDERFYPCTVEWFLERCNLSIVRKGFGRKVQEVLQSYGGLTPERLRDAQKLWNSRGRRAKRRTFLQLFLDPDARAGQPVDMLSQMPIYVHVKEVVDPQGRRAALEVNYMKFLAYNGFYKLFGIFYAGEIGAHDADWEHVTLRLSPDAQKVLGIYYSAHRHRDGVWRSADEMLRGDDGRPKAFIATNGHGSYPEPGTVPRVFFIFPDETSDQGHVWKSTKCHLITPSGRLPQVMDRGNELNGSTYDACGAEGPPPDVEVVRDPAVWLGYEGRWGSSVVAPQLQEWFERAENPVSRTWLQQVFFPLLPGVESIYEPAMESAEEVVDDLKENVDQALDSFRK
ncbi:hypothetical protein WJX84_004091 [Apatococcus fuscideae]|uniref:Uncharacterized protein n=1 Tax=Apatococcus fuscideae TaxID=2026836 RepID=A0AAW1SUR0_9CHLO